MRMSAAIRTPPPTPSPHKSPPPLICELLLLVHQPQAQTLPAAPSPLGSYPGTILEPSNDSLLAGDPAQACSKPRILNDVRSRQQEATLRPEARLGHGLASHRATGVTCSSLHLLANRHSRTAATTRQQTQLATPHTGPHSTLARQRAPTRPPLAPARFPLRRNLSPG